MYYVTKYIDIYILYILDFYTWKSSHKPTQENNPKKKYKHLKQKWKQTIKHEINFIPTCIYISRAQQWTWNVDYSSKDNVVSSLKLTLKVTYFVRYLRQSVEFILTLVFAFCFFSFFVVVFVCLCLFFRCA